MKRAGLALGANLGNSVASIKKARDFISGLNADGSLFLQSGLYITKPVACPEGSGDYVNAVVEIGWNGAPDELLARCQEIELFLGRIRTGIAGEPRTIDIDVLYCGNEVVAGDKLVLPHPRMHQRKFVLRPLNDIRPELVLPGQSATVSELLLLSDDSEPDPVPYAIKW